MDRDTARGGSRRSRACSSEGTSRTAGSRPGPSTTITKACPAMPPTATGPDRSCRAVNRHEGVPRALHGRAMGAGGLGRGHGRLPPRHDRRLHDPRPRRGHGIERRAGEGREPRHCDPPLPVRARGPARREPRGFHGSSSSARSLKALRREASPSKAARSSARRRRSRLSAWTARPSGLPAAQVVLPHPPGDPRRGLRPVPRRQVHGQPGRVP